MDILIYGASGATGHELVKQALGQGHKVTAFVRTPSKLKIAHQNLKVMQGDVINYQIVEDAVKGQDAVLSALGAPSPFKYDQSVVDGISNIVKAMEHVEVGRIIYLSAINVKESLSNAGPLVKFVAPIFLRNETAGHEAREKIIRQSRLQWTFIRAGGLTNGGHKAVYRSGEDIRAKGIAASISRADVADFMLRQLADKTFLRKAPTIMY